MTPTATGRGSRPTAGWRTRSVIVLALAVAAVLALGWIGRDLITPRSHREATADSTVIAHDGSAGTGEPALQALKVDRRLEGRPYLGITYVPVSPRVASRYGLEVDWGILITAAAAGGPADRAGVQAGDILLLLDDQAISPDVSFLDLLWHRRPGATVKLVVWREGRHFTTEAVLGTQ